MNVYKVRRETVFLLCLLSLLFSSAAASGEQGLNLFRIGTGGKTGVYYPIGKLIAHGISRHHIPVSKDGSGQDLIAIAQNSGGSINNVKGILAGELEAGLVQADIASMTFEGSGSFADEAHAKDIRVIASLYPEKFQIAVRRDSGIQKFRDLRGKRISVDEPGSGTLAVMRIVLAAHDLTEEDFSPVYLKPVFTHDKIASGELNGFVMMGGTPMEAVTKLLDQDMSLVPIERETARLISQKYPYLVAGKIPTGIYPGIPETDTIQVFALLVVKKSMDADLVYNITKALWADDTQSLLENGHPQGALISADSALSGLSIPLHEGAKRYYADNSDRFPGLATQ